MLAREKETEPEYELETEQEIINRILGIMREWEQRQGRNKGGLVQ